MIANGSFLLNEAVVNPARRPWPMRVLDWVGGEIKASGSGRWVLRARADEGMPSLWDLLRRIPSLRWVAIQVGLAASWRPWHVHLAWAVPPGPSIGGRPARRTCAGTGGLARAS